MQRLFADAVIIKADYLQYDWTMVSFAPPRRNLGVFEFKFQIRIFNTCFVSSREINAQISRALCLYFDNVTCLN